MGSEVFAVLDLLLECLYRLDARLVEARFEGIHLICDTVPQSRFLLAKLGEILLRASVFLGPGHAIAGCRQLVFDLGVFGKVIRLVRRPEI